jgi:hypothetical protein
MRFLGGMKNYVSLQIRLVDKSFWTLCALKWFIVAMLCHVHIKCFACLIFFAAFHAFVRLYAYMSSLVVLRQVTFFCESFIAQLTRKLTAAALTT